MLEPKILYKIYELKGMIHSFKDSAAHHDKYNYPLIKKIEETMETIIKMVEVQERRNEKVLFPSRFAISKNVRRSTGFHSKTNA